MLGFCDVTARTLDDLKVSAKRNHICAVLISKRWRRTPSSSAATFGAFDWEGTPPAVPEKPLVQPRPRPQAIIHHLPAGLAVVSPLRTAAVGRLKSSHLRDSRLIVNNTFNIRPQKRTFLLLPKHADQKKKQRRNSAQGLPASLGLALRRMPFLGGGIDGAENSRYPSLHGSPGSRAGSDTASSPHHQFHRPGKASDAEPALTMPASPVQSSFAAFSFDQRASEEAERCASGVGC